MFIFFCFSNHYLRVHLLSLFFYVYFNIYFPDSQEVLIHRVSNYSNLLLEMPRFYYPLIEKRLKLRTDCQDHQAGESAVKCLFQGQKRMVQVGFELRLCQSQSRRSKRLTTMLSKQYLFVFYLVNFFSEHSLFLQCVHLLLAHSHFFHASVCKATSSNNHGSYSLRDFIVILIKYCEFYPFVCFP